MKNRERLLAALNHEETDRVPMDLGATRDSSMVLAGYERLKASLEIKSETKLVSLMMQVVKVDDAVLDALDIDTQGVFPGGPAPEILDENRYRDDWGVERVKPEGALYYDQETYPLAGDISLSDIAQYHWPDPQDPAYTDGLVEQVERLRNETDRALVLNVPSGFVHISQYLRGFEDWFMDCTINPELIGALFDAVLEVNMGVCDAILSRVGDKVDVVMTADDLGLQNGLLIDPAIYRQIIKPRQQRYFRMIHEKSPAKLFFHTCGSVIDIIDDLVEIGVDILNPIQVSARGMDPEILKNRWGDKLSFWGAIDTQHVLPHGSVQDVKAEVDRRIAQLSRGGGYVLSAVHNIQPDVPTENVLAMFRHSI